MISISRLSRISHPRATLWTLVLLVVVFLSFGLFVQARHPGLGAAAPEFSAFDERSDETGDVTWVQALGAVPQAPMETGSSPAGNRR